MSYSTLWQNEIRVARPKNKRDELFDVQAIKSDKQLVDLVLANDEHAFECLFERHKRYVAIIAGRYFQNPEQVEEIIQMSFVKAFFELKNFRGEHDFSLARWLGRITSNTCLDMLRSQKRNPTRLICELSDEEREWLSDDLSNGESTAETDFIHRDLAEKLLSQLEAEDRTVLHMLYAKEMSVAQVAEITGWSTAKTKSRAYRARHALKKILRRFS